MPGTMRLNPKELFELIESIEAIGGDATELRTLLAEVSQESQYKTKVFSRPRPADEEPTTQERLESEAGYLFPNGITNDILNKLIEFDRDRSSKELKRMCVEAELSPSGHKKLLAARLLAHERGQNDSRASS